MKELISKVSSGENLSVEEAERAMGLILTSATDAQIGAFLMGLKMKGETPDEIAGLVRGMKKVAHTISPNVSPLIDTCGTGGDRYDTINVSTAAAIVAASTGISVAKHGNFSITSKCGSADVLRELGVKIDLSPPEVKRLIESIGIGFMLAPVFHPTMKRVVQPRREIGVRTIFNILGPLTNPANAEAQLIGVYDGLLCEKLANVLRVLGTKKALVVNGDGLDEISNIGETMVAELSDGRIKTYSITPDELGFEVATPEDIAGGTPEENAAALVRVLSGEKGACRDIIVMNSAAAIFVGGGAKSLKGGVQRAEESIDSGAALSKLKELVECTGDPGKLKRFL
ncbi:MAG: anthranilate phosphoribosyltransferase [Methanocellales archaeon]|nr:anthranilate phosphoribosyltransferase [Methanocellales archaeon]